MLNLYSRFKDLLRNIIQLIWDINNIKKFKLIDRIKYVSIVLKNLFIQLFRII